jgi:hypothetical protein
VHVPIAQAKDACFKLEKEAIQTADKLPGGSAAYLTDLKNHARDCKMYGNQVDHLLQWQELPDGKEFTCYNLRVFLGCVAQVVKAANESLEKIKGYIKSKK